MVAGICRGITNATAACDIDQDPSDTTSCETATAFRADQTWDDGGHRPPSQQALQVGAQAEIPEVQSGQCERREYAEWPPAKRVRKDADTAHIARFSLEATAGRDGRHERGLTGGMRFIRRGAILRKIRIVAEWLGMRVTEVSPRDASRGRSVCVYARNYAGRGKHSCV